ncbi:hypothetical protein PWT90_05879 [Aphanocladium album]|nr:hypothetical protein PWT90_05879 [Aphanocladium album]
MIWPPARRASSSSLSGTVADTMATTGGDGGAAPLWTQDSASTRATDYNNGTSDEDDNDYDPDHNNDNLAWSQPSSPALGTTAGHLAESPFIPSAQPVFYPFSQPASGIRPLTPPSPLRPHLEFGDSFGSELGTDSDVDDLLEEILQGVSGVTL